MDLASLQGWISDVLDEHAEKIYRFKGIVNVHNEDKRLAFHGVHSCFDCDFLSEWKADEKRTSKVVFIGRDLPFEELRKTWEQCRIDAVEKYQPKEDDSEIPAKSQMHVQAQVMNAQAQMQPGVEGPVGGRSLWLECKRGDDAPYFYNPMTQQSVWEKPTGPDNLVMKIDEYMKVQMKAQERYREAQAKRARVGQQGAGDQ